MADPDLTALLSDLEDGNRDAVDRILPLVYPELQAMAQRHLSGERDGHTLDTSALVHEAYLKLVKQDRTTWKNRAHFFGVATLAMRRILVTYAHARNAEKRGGGVAAITLMDDRTARETQSDELIALDEALTRLATVAERPAKIVELRFFGGLKHHEIAEVLDISEATVQRDWRMARAWLATDLNEPLDTRLA
ncbi:MAG: sigma-70 family RNA polymerase sigma factor [Rubricoccaceae bacterium]